MEEYLSGTEFELELSKAVLKFVPGHIKACLDNPELDCPNYGTATEMKLKLIAKFYANISVVLRDIDLTLNFLGKERAQIIDHYPFLDSQETYFKYHYENYFIRLITILDLIGKLGTLLYNMNQNLEKVSAHTFKDKARKEGYEDIATIIERLIEKVSELKVERHKKLHTGKADIKPFNGTVIWEDFNVQIGSDTNKILKQYTDQKIKEEIEILKSSTIELINIIKEFLEKSNTKLKEIITTANIV